MGVGSETRIGPVASAVERPGRWRLRPGHGVQGSVSDVHWDREDPIVAEERGYSDPTAVAIQLGLVG